MYCSWEYSLSYNTYGEKQDVSKYLITWLYLGLMKDRPSTSPFTVGLVLVRNIFVCIADWLQLQYSLISYSKCSKFVSCIHAVSMNDYFSLLFYQHFHYYGIYFKKDSKEDYIVLKRCMCMWKNCLFYAVYIIHSLWNT